MSEDYRVLYTRGCPRLDPPVFIPSGTYSVESAGTYNIRNYEFVEVLIETNQLKKISGNARTNWVLTSKGDLWGCGDNSQRQQGFSRVYDCEAKKYLNYMPYFSTRIGNVKDFACSEFTTWAIKNDGTLWGCGKANLGQQGTNNSQELYSGTVAFTQRMTNAKKVFCTTDTTWVIKNDDSLKGRKLESN